ncbi:hypothetical protein [Micromonospora sp. DT47]|uniref:hypothetical protein n=1 Tax=Micromonospora sp. DT47 TaxID=3393431 RepID=UPI003CF0D8C8
MGHDSSQAALIYQHATAEADRAIAQALHEAVRADRKRAKKVGKTKTAADKPAKRKCAADRKTGGKKRRNLGGGDGLGEANMDLADFADGVDESGTFRGFEGG